MKYHHNCAFENPDGGCHALSEMVCLEKPCPFYQTPEGLRLGRLKANVRLEIRGYPTERSDKR